MIIYNLIIAESIEMQHEPTQRHNRVVKLFSGFYLWLPNPIFQYNIYGLISHSGECVLREAVLVNTRGIFGTQYLTDANYATMTHTPVPTVLESFIYLINAWALLLMFVCNKEISNWNFHWQLSMIKYHIF